MHDSKDSQNIDGIPEIWVGADVKTTLELPDDLMREIRVLAARQDRRMKDIVEESLRRTLAIEKGVPRTSIRSLKAVSLGRIMLENEEDADRLGEMLDERGHRY